MLKRTMWSFLTDDKQATCYPAQKFVDALKQKDNLEQRVVVGMYCEAWLLCRDERVRPSHLHAH
jgi:hypothetical protein